MKKILSACNSHPNPKRVIQLRAIVLLMRHSGLRMGDACTLSRDRIKNGRLELYTEKTGTKVQIPLKPEVLEALEKIPNRNDYFFWTGVSKRKTVSNDWEAIFQKLFERAGIAGGHSHQFRHSFATRLLEKGVSMENLSKLLGHRSIKVTEKHYASFGQGRQKHLEDEVRKTW